MTAIVNALKTHIPAIVIILALVVGFHSWLQEHDSRLKAEQTVAVAQVQVKSLQDQIQLVNQAAAAKVQVVTKVVHDVKTSTEAVSAIPVLTDVPLNGRVSIDNPSQLSVDALPLVSLLGQSRIDKTNLDACQANTVSLQSIITTRETEIASLRKPAGFWHRVGSTLKVAAVGVGIGVALGAHL